MSLPHWTEHTCKGKLYSEYKHGSFDVNEGTSPLITEYIQMNKMMQLSVQIDTLLCES